MYREGKSSFWFKFLLFIFALIVAIFFLLFLRIWGTNWTSYLFRTDKWIELIFVSAVVYGFSMLITKLLQWSSRKL